MNTKHVCYLNTLIYFLALSSGVVHASRNTTLLKESEAELLTLSPAEAKAHELKVLRDVANLALLPPRLNNDPLPEFSYKNLDYAMNRGIERSPGGRLFTAWVGGEDGPGAFMLVAKSDDDGATWSEPILVINSQAEHLPIYRTVQVGNLWTDPQGRLWLFFNQTMNRFDGRDGLWATVCENLDEDTLSWSEPRYIWYGSALNKPIIMTNGDWLLPVQLFDHMDGGRGPFKVGVFPELDPMRGANVLVSSDQGKTWKRRGGRPFPEPNFYEHHVVELRNGSLWMLARTQNSIMQSFSEDMGRTWSEPTFPDLIKHPVSRFHVQRLASGRILLIKHGDTIDSHDGRSKLTAWLSDNEGKTWRGGLMLDERTGVSYPDGFQGPDGRIYISYDRNRSTDAEILMAQFTEKDIFEKRIIDSKSKLKMLVSRAMGNKKVIP